MPILVFITFAAIIYVVILERAETKQRHIPFLLLAVGALMGLVLSFALLLYLIMGYVPNDDAFPGSGSIETGMISSQLEFS